MSHAKREFGFWAQLETKELLADMQWMSASGRWRSGMGGDHASRCEDAELSRKLQAANDSCSSPIALPVLQQPEPERTKVLCQVLESCLSCEELRLTYLSIISSVAPRKQQLLWPAVLHHQQQVKSHGDTECKHVEELSAILSSGICLGDTTSPIPEELPSAAESIESYWDRLMACSTVYEGGGRCAADLLDLRQLEKDITRETILLNGRTLRGADGLVDIMIKICSCIRESEVTYPRNVKGDISSWSSFKDPPETLTALAALGMLPPCCLDHGVDLSSDNLTDAAPIKEEGFALWRSACRIFCGLRLLSLAARTNCGGAAFTAAMAAYGYPSLPLVVQTHNHVKLPEDRDGCAEQKLEEHTQNPTDLIISCMLPSSIDTQSTMTNSDDVDADSASQTAGSLVVYVHSKTPFKLLLPQTSEYPLECRNPEASSARASGERDSQGNSVVLSAAELCGKLEGVRVDGHYFASLKSVMLRQPPAELLKFDKALAEEVRQRSSSAALISAILADELSFSGSSPTGDESAIVWLPSHKSLQWVLLQANLDAGNKSTPVGEWS